MYDKWNWTAAVMTDGPLQRRPYRPVRKYCRCKTTKKKEEEEKEEEGEGEEEEEEEKEEEEELERKE